MFSFLTLVLACTVTWALAVDSGYDTGAEQVYMIQAVRGRCNSVTALAADIKKNGGGVYNSAAEQAACNTQIAAFVQQLVDEGNSSGEELKKSLSVMSDTRARKDGGPTAAEKKQAIANFNAGLAVAAVTTNTKPVGTAETNSLFEALAASQADRGAKADAYNKALWDAVTHPKVAKKQAALTKATADFTAALNGARASVQQQLAAAVTKGYPGAQALLTRYNLQFAAQDRFIVERDNRIKAIGALTASAKTAQEKKAAKAQKVELDKWILAQKKILVEGLADGSVPGELNLITEMRAMEVSVTGGYTVASPSPSPSVSASPATGADNPYGTIIGVPNNAASGTGTNSDGTNTETKVNSAY
jgi:hypothetical protein